MIDHGAPRQSRSADLPRTRAEHLAADLETRIRTQGSPAGTPVGTIENLRTESGFARATVSEAVRLLADRGVLTVRPGRGGGLFVADQGPVVRMRRTLLAADHATEVADAVELRNHLEALIDLGAARTCGESDAAALRAGLRAMRDAGDWAGFLRANWSLHERIAALCPNAMARAVYTGALGSLGATTPRLDAADTSDDDVAAYRARRLQVHVDLVEAIAGGDEEAVRAAVAAHNRTD
jgi:GntR family transcriptional repressor for pyruvate dehydrogenase complex